MKIKTSEATKLQLDWGLAKALKKRVRYCSIYKAVVFDDCEDNLYLFSHTDPAVCMGLIEQYSLAFSECDTSHLYGKPDTLWRVVCRNGSGYGESKVLAQAVARCVISMKSGEQFEVPDELGVQL